MVDPHEPTKGYGELILFYESGYVPAKYEETLTFPILKTDSFEDEPKKGRGKRKTSNYFQNARVARRGKFLFGNQVGVSSARRNARNSFQSPPTHRDCCRSRRSRTERDSGCRCRNYGNRNAKISGGGHSPAHGGACFVEIPCLPGNNEEIGR